MAVADINPHAEVATAKAAADNIARRVAAGEIQWKRRHQFQVTVRALRFYAAALQFELDRVAVPAAIKAAGGGDCHPLVPSTDQRHQEASVLHATKMERIDEQCLTRDGQETHDLG